MFRTGRTVTNWLDALDEINSLREEYNKNYSIMTAYERQTVEDYLARRRRANRDYIARGMVAEFNDAIDRYQAAQSHVKAEWQKEINRWNAARLRDEMQLFEMRVKAVLDRNNHPSDDPSGELRAIYDEGMQSGDNHKARAVAEVMTNALSNGVGRVVMDDSGIRTRITSIAQQARRELAEMRVTAEMKAAEQAQQDAEQAVIGAHRALDRTAEILGYGDAMRAHGPLSAAFERLNWDDSGALIIHPEKERSEWLEEWRERMGIG